MKHRHVHSHARYRIQAIPYGVSLCWPAKAEKQYRGHSVKKRLDLSRRYLRSYYDDEECSVHRNFPSCTRKFATSVVKKRTAWCILICLMPCTTLHCTSCAFTFPTAAPSSAPPFGPIRLGPVPTRLPSPPFFGPFSPFLSESATAAISSRT